MAAAKIRKHWAAHDEGRALDLFEFAPVGSAADPNEAAALRDAMTKQLAFGAPPTGRTIHGPLFDTQLDFLK